MRSLYESILSSNGAGIESKVKSFLDKYERHWANKNKWTWNAKEKVVDVVGDIHISGDFEEIPFQFGKVTGRFSCRECPNLVSLKGCPREVGGDCNFGQCSIITTLDGSPEEVGGNFDCSDCYRLKSLKGAPKKIGGDFVHGCKFTDNDIPKYCTIKHQKK